MYNIIRLIFVYDKKKKNDKNEPYNNNKYIRLKIILNTLI